LWSASAAEAEWKVEPPHFVEKCFIELHRRKRFGLALDRVYPDFLVHVPPTNQSNWDQLIFGRNESSIFGRNESSIFGRNESSAAGS
jgi:hypothetical protein